MGNWRISQLARDVQVQVMQYYLFSYLSVCIEDFDPLRGHEEVDLSRGRSLPVGALRSQTKKPHDKWPEGARKQTLNTFNLSKYLSKPHLEIVTNNFHRFFIILRPNWLIDRLINNINKHRRSPRWQCRPLTTICSLLQDLEIHSPIFLRNIICRERQGRSLDTKH